MNDGVKLLIERMKTNPDEFVKGHKWIGIINSYKEYLNEEDATLLRNALNELHQQTFTEQVMKELLAPEEEDDLGKYFTVHPTGTPLGGATPLRSSVALNNTNAITGTINTGLGSQALVGTWGSSALDAQTYQLEQMKVQAQIKAIKEEYNKQQKHETLFGKLKNYLHSD